MRWKHFVARASTPYEPFKDFETASWMWKNLETVFPEMLAAVLMPNHLHLILPTQKPDDHIQNQLNGLLGVLSRQKKVRKLWQASPPPGEIPDRHHLKRQIRYVALNPCRKSLCKDPLEWYWSTYRGLMGADTKSEARLKATVKALKESSRDLSKDSKCLQNSIKGFQVRFHSYVSGDPSVRVEGSPFPKSHLPATFAMKSIGEILAASAAALRMEPEEVLRRGELRALFIHLAWRHQWRQTQTLSMICDVTTRSVQRILQQPLPREVSAAELCLGDVRLIRPGLESAEIFLSRCQL